MAWKWVRPMDERVRFVWDVQRGFESVSQLCRQFGISRKTGYKWMARYEAEGIEGLRERSRRPRRSPTRTDEHWVRTVVEQRRAHPRWGPKKLWQLLGRVRRVGPRPAVSTIGLILRREGLAERRRRRGRPRVTPSGPLQRPTRPNQVWAVDFKGWFRTGDGRRCEPLTVSDVYSRYVLLVRALPDQSYERTKQAMSELFRQYGLPERIRCDNGGPFASTGVGGLSRLSVWWMQLGIVVERIEPGHPEQNGVHERMHGTLKADTIRPAAANGRAQQRRFSRWRAQFNEHRPHEALSMQTPSQWYRRARRRLPRRLTPWSYSWEYAVRRVRHNGEIKWRGRRRYVGQALHGVAVGLKPTDHGTTAVYLGSLWLGDLEQTDAGGLRPTVSSPRIGNKMKSVTHVLR